MPRAVTFSKPHQSADTDVLSGDIRSPTFSGTVFGQHAQYRGGFNNNDAESLLILPS